MRALVAPEVTAKAMTPMLANAVATGIRVRVRGRVRRGDCRRDAGDAGDRCRHKDLG